MQPNRKGETGPVPFRSGRFFNVAGQWFFASREGIDHGPYPSRVECDKALEAFLQDVGMIGGFEQRIATT